MPRARNEGSSTNLPALPEDVMADLLRAQADQIETVQSLPNVKIMPAAAGLYEFGDTNDTTREFRGVILHSHKRNVLWDRAYGEERPAAREGEEEQNLPACSSEDGRIGVPRTGFAHAALGGRSASGTERIECATCPYNQWDSKRLIEPGTTKKGKAVTNQRAVYVMVEDRGTPVRLTLPPTSLAPFDEYLSTLLNQGVPVQAVQTVFKQRRMEKGQLRWSVAVFENGGPVDGEVFNRAMEMRSTFSQQINPRVVETMEEAEYVEVSDGDEDLPF